MPSTLTQLPVTELVAAYNRLVDQNARIRSRSDHQAAFNLEESIYDIALEWDHRYLEATSETWDDADRCEPHTVCLTRVRVFRHQCDMDPENCDPIDLDLSYDPDDVEGPTCSICDGLGHGYVGGPPCPLEDRADYSTEPWWAQ